MGAKGLKVCVKKTRKNTRSLLIRTQNCCDGVLIWLKWSFSVVVQFFILLRWLI